MSRFRRALAATTMAVAAAGGGLLIAAAGAVPAYASVPAAPPGGHTITITAHPKAHSGHGIGPHDILPCTVKPGAKKPGAKKPGVTPASCGDQTISCSITAPAPTLAAGDINSHATVTCSRTVTEIDLVEILIRSPGGNLQNQFPFTNTGGGTVGVGAGCQATTYTNYGSALITFPEGYVLTGGSNPIHQTSAPVTFSASACRPSGGGGGGGGGCAIHAPSLAGHPAGRHPDFISCG